MVRSLPLLGMKQLRGPALLMFSKWGADNANGMRLGSGQEMETPQCLVNSIGLTHKFKVKVTPYNFTAKRQIITATRVSVLQYPHLLILQGYTGHPHRCLRCA
ncbi:hypothetical protein IGI04_035593 [Brassica rapa subsp. trilocularis]|uniref:Uncharacterized protein n=1 Tax=Brassica rapa subsp. trilocularis TaxID=1813537 RepID=A0ABQ7LC18_BRACM|nr:hypothetical protein IGI04_035593 [Brassica rapa subsp. trilocularis]